MSRLMFAARQCDFKTRCALSSRSQQRICRPVPRGIPNAAPVTRDAAAACGRAVDRLVHARLVHPGAQGLVTTGDAGHADRRCSSQQCSHNRHVPGGKASRRRPRVSRRCDSCWKLSEHHRCALHDALLCVPAVAKAKGEAAVNQARIDAENRSQLSKVRVFCRYRPVIVAVIALCACRLKRC